MNNDESSDKWKRFFKLRLMYVNILQQITSPLFSTFETFSFFLLFITLLLYFFADESTPEKKKQFMICLNSNSSLILGSVLLQESGKFPGEADDI